MAGKEFLGFFPQRPMLPPWAENSHPPFPIFLFRNPNKPIDFQGFGTILRNIFSQRFV